MPFSERVEWHLAAGRIPRAFQLATIEREMRALGMSERQVIREYGLPPLMPMPQVVYLLGHSRKPADGDPVKIGTAKNVANRIENLQAGSLHKLYLVAWIKGDRELEGKIHAEVAATCIREDWFEMSPAIREAFRLRIEKQAKEMVA